MDYSGVFSSGQSFLKAIQYSDTELLTSFLKYSKPKRLGKVINAIVIPERVHIMVVSINAAKKKAMTYTILK